MWRSTSASTLTCFVVAIVGCDSAVRSSDGRDGDASVSATDAGTDAASASHACETDVAWDLAAGLWSTAYAPHGVGGEGVAIVVDLAWHDDELYLGGVFTHAGALPSANVAAWSPTRGWRALGAGLPDIVVERLAVAPDGHVAAAGFTPSTTGLPSHSVDVLDAEAWVEIGQADADIADLIYDADGALLVAGAFTTIGGATSAGLARWDGVRWEDLPTGRADATALLADATSVCVAGHDTLGVYVACRPAGATEWEIDDLPPQTAMAAIVSMTRDASGALIAAGTIDGGIVRWDGAAWTTLGGGLPSSRIAVSRAADGTLWATGAIEASPGAPGATANVVQWIDGAWAPVGRGVTASGAFAIAAGGSEVYVAGEFDAALDVDGEAVAAHRVARWNGAAWSTLEQPGVTALGLDHVSSVALGPDCELLASGAFLAAGDRASRSIARLFAGGVWESPTLSPTAATSVPHVAIGADGTAYATLEFDLGGPSGLARLRDGAWERISDVGDIRGIELAGDGTMYVGGEFDEGLLAWDGSTWSTVGTRAPAPVCALAVDGDVLWVVENDASGARLSRLRDGLWSVVATGLESLPSAIVPWRDTVVLVGRTVLAHESRIVRVRDSWLEPLPFEGDGELAAVATFGSALIVAGRDGSSSTSPGLARWSDDGAHWRELGSFDGPVTDIVVRAGGVLFGGDFQSVDGVASVGLAELRSP